MIKPQAISLTSSPTILIFLHPTQVTLASGGGGGGSLDRSSMPISGPLHLLFSGWNGPLPGHMILIG